MQNMMSTGTFFVIEGTDGSGKGTQFQLLADQLTKAGYQVATFDFPQYDVPSSYFVKQYLNGEYGGAEDVGPYTASLFYALDRYEAAPKIRKALADGKIVLANRFVGSNMAHQGTKFYNPEERRGYFIWLDNLEFEMLHVPRPTMSFVLRVPAEIAQNLVDRKEDRAYTDKKRDIHEADLSHLLRSVEVYDDLTQLFPKDFQRIDCVRDGQLLPVEAVQDLIWQKIHPMLPEPPLALPTSQSNMQVSPAQVIEEVPRGGGHVAAAGEAPRGGSRGGAPAARSEASTVGEVSADRTPRQGEATLEQPVAPELAYVIPDNLSPEAESQYRAFVDHTETAYKELLRQLTDYLTDTSKTPQQARDAAWQSAIQAKATQAARPVLPVAMESVIDGHMAGQSPKVAAFATTNLHEKLAAEAAPVTLSDIWPRNELDLVADMLYEYTNLPLAELRTEIATWPYDKKLQAFEAYTGNSEHRVALEKARYSWDLVSDYDSFQTLRRMHLGQDAEWQQLTPRYGYDMPKLIEEANLTDQFEECFDLSLRVYSYLQSVGYPREAQYVTLLGHNLRWKVTCNAGEAFRLQELAAEPDNPENYRRLIQRMHEKLTEKHPVLGEAMQLNA